MSDKVRLAPSASDDGRGCWRAARSAATWSSCAAASAATPTSATPSSEEFGITRGATSYRGAARRPEIEGVIDHHAQRHPQRR